MPITRTTRRVDIVWGRNRIIEQEVKHVTKITQTKHQHVYGNHQADRQAHAAHQIAFVKS